MNLLITIAAFIFMLGVTVAIHETGHFLVAKLCNVYVHEYSIGMGPKLFEKQGKETKYQLRLLPIGGFVSMAGEDVNVQKAADKSVPEERKFYNQPYWKKICILVAGVTMNFLLAIIIFSLLLLHTGGYAAPVKATITGVRENSPAEKAGFEVGDKIIKIQRSDGASMKINSFFDMQVFLYEETDQHSIIYTIERDGNQIDISVTQEYNAEEDRYIIGIQGTSTEIREVKWYNCIWYGIRYFIDTFLNLVTALKMLFMPNGFKQVSGPVGIASATGQVVANGFASYLNLVALLNVNIGMMNLLPLPVLDGGQIVLETIEKIRGKRISEKTKLVILEICWILLIGMMVAATYNDIKRLFFSNLMF